MASGNPGNLFAACAFILGVAAPEQLPAADRPEIALAGRSNAGKSSLINALTGRKALAKTSHTPGRTQQLNFFDLGGQAYMVDMPGYGYAKVPKVRKRDWDILIRDYLRGRPNLRCVFVLVDSRRGLTAADGEILELLDEFGVSYRIVLTKVDKVKTQHLEEVGNDIRNQLKKHPAAFPEPVLTSAHGGQGIEDFQEIIAACVL